MVTAEIAGELAVVVVAVVVGQQLVQKSEAAVLHGSAPELAAVWLKVLDVVVAAVVETTAGAVTGHYQLWRSESGVQTVDPNFL